MEGKRHRRDRPARPSGPASNAGSLRRKNHWAYVLAVNLVVIAAFFAAAELIVRNFMSYNRTFVERRESSVLYEASGFAQFVAVPDQMVFRLDRGTVTDEVTFKINRFGYRGDDFELRRPDDEIRIAILGGSHVFDIYSFEHDGHPGFPRLIQRKFEEAGYNVVVINAGLPGYNTRNALATLLYDLHRFDPQIVILNSIWNDLKWISRMSDSTSVLRTGTRAERKNPLLHGVNILDHLFGWSAIYRKAHDLYWRWKLGIDESFDEGIMDNATVEIKAFTRGLADYRKNLITMVQISRGFGAVPVLAIEERLVSASNTTDDKARLEYHYVNVNSHLELVDLFERCETIVRRVGDSLNVNVLDVNAEMEGNAEYFADHVHTTPAGSEYMAGRYFELLHPMVDEAVRAQSD